MMLRNDIITSFLKGKLIIEGNKDMIWITLFCISNSLYIINMILGIRKKYFNKDKDDKAI